MRSRRSAGGEAPYISALDPWSEDRVRDFVALNTIQRLRAYHRPADSPAPAIEPINAMRAANLVLLPPADPDYRPCFGEKPLTSAHYRAKMARRRLEERRHNGEVSAEEEEGEEEEEEDDDDADDIEEEQTKRESELKEGMACTSATSLSSNSRKDLDMEEFRLKGQEEREGRNGSREEHPEHQCCAVERARVVFFGAASFTSSTSPRQLLHSPHVPLTPSVSVAGTSVKCTPVKEDLAPSLAQSGGGGEGGEGGGARWEVVTGGSPRDEASDTQMSQASLRLQGVAGRSLKDDLDTYILQNSTPLKDHFQRRRGDGSGVVTKTEEEEDDEEEIKMDVARDGTPAAKPPPRLFHSSVAHDEVVEEGTSRNAEGGETTTTIIAPSSSFSSAKQQQQQQPVPYRYSCEVCDALVAYYQSMLARGVVIDRFNHKDLAFSWWVIGRDMDTAALDRPGTMRREALLISLRNAYFGLLSSKRRTGVAAEGTASESGTEGTVQHTSDATDATSTTAAAVAGGSNTPSTHGKADTVVTGTPSGAEELKEGWGEGPTTPPTRASQQRRRGAMEKAKSVIGVHASMGAAESLASSKSSSSSNQRRRRRSSTLPASNKKGKGKQHDEEGVGEGGSSKREADKDESATRAKPTLKGSAKRARKESSIPEEEKFDPKIPPKHVSELPYAADDEEEESISLLTSGALEQHYKDSIALSTAASSREGSASSTRRYLTVEERRKIVEDTWRPVRSTRRRTAAVEATSDLERASEEESTANHHKRRPVSGSELVTASAASASTAKDSARPSQGETTAKQLGGEAVKSSSRTGGGVQRKGAGENAAAAASIVALEGSTTASAIPASAVCGPPTSPSSSQATTAPPGGKKRPGEHRSRCKPPSSSLTPAAAGATSASALDTAGEPDEKEDRSGKARWKSEAAVEEAEQASTTPLTILSSLSAPPPPLVELSVYEQEVQTRVQGHLVAGPNASAAYSFLMTSSVHLCDGLKEHRLHQQQQLGRVRRQRGAGSFLSPSTASSTATAAAAAERRGRKTDSPGIVDRALFASLVRHDQVQLEALVASRRKRTLVSRRRGSCGGGGCCEEEVVKSEMGGGNKPAAREASHTSLSLHLTPPTTFTGSPAILGAQSTHTTTAVTGSPPTSRPTMTPFPQLPYAQQCLLVWEAASLLAAEERRVQLIEERKARVMATRRMATRRMATAVAEATAVDLLAETSSSSSSSSSPSSSRSASRSSTVSDQEGNAHGDEKSRKHKKKKALTNSGAGAKGEREEEADDRHGMGAIVAQEGDKAPRRGYVDYWASYRANAELHGAKV